MYAWYAAAKVCFVYLSDLDPAAADENLEQALPRCRWFKRGWTLQELIAPRHVIFHDRDWNERGTKDSLSSLLSKITTIPEELLRVDKRLDHYAVGRRMSWASMRKTTRREDEAYCLLGIFNVNMPLLYGEGEAAFFRLQKIIVEELADLSLFVWTDEIEEGGEERDGNGKITAKRAPWSSMFAVSPRQFSCAGKLEATLADSTYRNLRSRPRGIQVEASLIFRFSEIDKDDGNECIYDTICMIDGMPIGVMIRKIGGGRYPIGGLV
ncbi:uncharacterized protein QC763_0082980 [Podospora pseudopauciseta]|uniref:DUF8212 domain-containing protein n=1 Tax=Podospora pseudopauciseta TaxID=2093780 RepID=A0ABR0H8C1_9PEZI|nr:hypothetical protein QC763_0082980 [Podospora pseudopauciseta]